MMVDSPNGEELGRLCDGEHSERRDKRVVHQTHSSSGHLWLEAPLPSSPPASRWSTFPAEKDVNLPCGSNREGREGESERERTRRLLALS